MKSESQKLGIQLLWIILLLITHVLFSYYKYLHGWWCSSIGTVLILLLCYLNWNKDYLRIAGLNLNFKIVVKSIFTTAIVSVCSLLLMKYIAEKLNVSIIHISKWIDYYHDVFYILNEEIVLGALVLFYLTQKRKIKPIYASFGLALFFSAIHFVFYRWIFTDKGIIQIPALITLFLIGFVRNNLIIVYGHVGYSWALHFGWIVIMFGSIHQYNDTHMIMSELDGFNNYLGSIETLIISFALAVVSFLYWLKRTTFQEQHVKPKRKTF
jgi:hypothetical protein